MTVRPVHIVHEDVFALACPSCFGDLPPGSPFCIVRISDCPGLVRRCEATGYGKVDPRANTVVCLACACEIDRAASPEKGRPVSPAVRVLATVMAVFVAPFVLAVCLVATCWVVASAFFGKLHYRDCGF